MKNSLTKTLKTAVATAALAVGTLTMHAQGLSYYYGHYLLNTNTVIAGQLVTNFVAANYHVSGPWCSTKGITATDPNATGYTLQLVTAQNTPNVPQYSTNILLTLAPILDDDSLVLKLPPATNQAFTVSLAAAPGTNAFTSMIQISATNTLGAKQFKLISACYNGTNNLNLISARAGFWY